MAAENSRSNSFDFLRVSAALLVLYSHSYSLVGLPEPAPMAGQSYGSLAVALFFAISGYLVCQSWVRDPSPMRFVVRRALRILPGLGVVVLLTAFVLGPVFSSLSAQEYFADKRTWSYLPSTFFMMGVPALPGLFESNPFPKSNNGSLWTLRYEVLMYASLALFGSLVRKEHLKAVCLTCLVGCTLLWLGLHAYSPASMQVPGLWRLGVELYLDRIGNLGAYFFGGCCMFLFADRIRLNLVLATVLLSVAVLFPSAAAVTVALWVAIPYFAISFGLRAPHIFSKLSGFDYSYGIYIYAFPVQQAVTFLILPDASQKWLLALSISLVVTCVLAGLSWTLVERPSLAHKGRLVRKQ